MMFARTVKNFVAIVAGMVLATTATVDGGVFARPAQAHSLDKTGTTGCRLLNNHPQLLCESAFADGGSFQAERAGFEPAEGSKVPSPV
jgi:hypothetical protein